MRKDPKVRRTIAATAVAAVSLLVIGWLLGFGRPGRAAAWSGCLGKRLDDCRIPPGFMTPLEPCPDYLECSTHPPGVRYATSSDAASSRTLWASTSYAVIALDAERRIVAVEMKRRYAAL